MRNIDELLLESLEITRNAGAIIKKQWDQPRKITHKGAIDLVTDTDRMVEEFLHDKLGRLVPDARFLGEETATGMESLESAGLCWVVDPVDGTTNFVHGVPMVAVSVALCQDGLPIMGVVDAPILRETFYAAKDTRAFLNGEPVEVSATAALRDSLVATGFPYEIEPELESILERLARVLPATQGLRRPGSAAIDLCWVACGRLDAFYEALLKPWDMAAGWLIVEEAGGQVSNFNGDAVAWNKPLLASNGQIHLAMSNLLAID